MELTLSPEYILNRFSNQVGSNISSFLKKPWVYQSLFWLVYFGLNTLRWGSYFDDYSYSIKSNLVEFPIHIILVYLNLYYLLPKLLSRSLSRYLLALFVAIMAMSLFRIVITYELVTTDVFRESGFEGIRLWDFKYILEVFVGELYVIGFTTAIKVTIDYVKNQKHLRLLEKQSLETELAMLKTQLQPHFFFNTLNNLYALTLDKSDQAPDTVLMLSELMSYVIYKGQLKQVPLTDEVKHIQNYLDLEKLRFGDRLKVSFSLSGDISGKSLPPLILLPFIENAFKHGVRGSMESIPMQISLSEEAGWLKFHVANQKPEQHGQHNGLPAQADKGIGLANTRRRLGLLYPENHALVIDEDTEQYAITLKIPLAK